MKWKPLEGTAEVLTEYGHVLGIPTGFEIVDLPTLSVQEAGEVFGINLSLCKAIIVIAPVEFLDSLPTLETGTLSWKHLEQKIDNSCGTMALLHLAINLFGHRDPINDKDAEIDEFLKSLSASADWSLIEKCPRLASLHEKYSVMGETAIDEDTELHYVVFLGHDVILDGRRKGPVQLKLSAGQDGSFPGSILTVLKEQIGKRTSHGCPELPIALFSLQPLAQD